MRIRNRLIAFYRRHSALELSLILVVSLMVAAFF